MKITIPASIQEATGRLTGLDRLLVATEWERAAIVATFVESSEQGVAVGKASSSLSPIQFAELGITGLRSKDTVRRYVEAWNSAGLPLPAPGETIELPTQSFPSNPDAGRNVKDDSRKTAIRNQAKADGTGASKAINVASNPKAMAAAIKADPQTAKAAVEALPAEVIAKHLKAHPEVLHADDGPPITANERKTIIDEVEQRRQEKALREMQHGEDLAEPLFFQHIEEWLVRARRGEAKAIDVLQRGSDYIVTELLSLSAQAVASE